LRYLLAYEKKHYFGADVEDELPTLLLGAPRKLVKTENPNGKQEVGLQG
jgi:hypothetical protein